MTAVSYPTRPAFANLPLRIAAARAAASLYLEDGEALVRDYIKSEQTRVVSTLCLPAQASAPRIDLEAVRTPTRVLKARYTLSHPTILKSGPVICLPAPASDKPLTLIEDISTTIRAIHQWDGSRRNLSTRPDLWLSRGGQGDVWLYQDVPPKPKMFITPPERLGVVGWLSMKGAGYEPAPRERMAKALANLQRAA